MGELKAREHRPESHTPLASPGPIANPACFSVPKEGLFTPPTEQAEKTAPESAEKKEGAESVPNGCTARAENQSPEGPSVAVEETTDWAYLAPGQGALDVAVDVMALVDGAQPAGVYRAFLRPLSTAELLEVIAWGRKVHLEASGNDLGEEAPGEAPRCLRAVLPVGHWLRSWRRPGATTGVKELDPPPEPLPSAADAEDSSGLLRNPELARRADMCQALTIAMGRVAGGLPRAALELAGELSASDTDAATRWLNAWAARNIEGAPHPGHAPEFLWPILRAAVGEGKLPNEIYRDERPRDPRGLQCAGCGTWAPEGSATKRRIQLVRVLNGQRLPDGWSQSLGSGGDHLPFGERLLCTECTRKEHPRHADQLCIWPFEAEPESCDRCGCELNDGAPQVRVFEDAGGPPNALLCPACGVADEDDAETDYAPPVAESGPFGPSPHLDLVAVRAAVRSLSRAARILETAWLRAAASHLSGPDGDVTVWLAEAHGCAARALVLSSAATDVLLAPRRKVNVRVPFEWEGKAVIPQTASLVAGELVWFRQTGWWSLRTRRPVEYGRLVPERDESIRAWKMTPEAKHLAALRGAR